jgi:hypothetical protein
MQLRDRGGIVQKAASWSRRATEADEWRDQRRYCKTVIRMRYRRAFSLIPGMATNMETNARSHEASEISREDLYEQVWTTPINHLAEKFGVSGSYLARVCSALNVPRPPLGYWQKKAGKPHLALNCRPRCLAIN